MRNVRYFIVFCITLISLVAFAEYFSVKEVQIEGPASIKGVEKLDGTFLPFLNEESVQKQIAHDNPSLADIRVYTYYPDMIYISSRIQRPLLAVKLVDGFALVGETGSVLSKNKEEETHLPVVNYYQGLFYNQFRIGEVVSQDEIVHSAQFLYGSKREGIVVRKIDITHENMIVLRTDSLEILITSTRDADKQLSTFVYTMRQLKRQGLEVKSIDVRFEKPIVKFL